MGQYANCFDVFHTGPPEKKGCYGCLVLLILIVLALLGTIFALGWILGSKHAKASVKGEQEPNLEQKL